MINRALACAALAAFAALLLPAGDVSARGFAGHGIVGFRSHHTFHHHHGNRWPGGWIAAYPDYAEPVAAIPEQIAPAYSVVPRCTPSVETVTVPSESGGERQLTIRRCSP